MSGEYERLMAQLSKREWHGKNYVWFPVGFGWSVDIEWGKKNTHDETVRRVTVSLVKPTVKEN